MKDELLVQKVAQYATGDQWGKKKKKETPERMMRWNQRKNNTQLWMGLMMEVKSDTVKNNVYRNLEC